MNYVTLTVIATEDARKIDGRIPGVFCNVEVPPLAFGNYAPTQLELKVWGKNQELLAPVKKGTKLFLEETELYFSYDKERRLQTNWLKGGNILHVPDQFPNINTVILSGRCVNDLQDTDYRTSASGWVDVRQALAVWNKQESPTYYNFKAQYNTKNKFRINYPELICNFLNKKHVPATIRGRIVTDTWNDKKTGESRSVTTILIADKQGVTLGSKTMENQMFQPATKKESIPTQTTKLEPQPDWSLAPNPAKAISAPTNQELENAPF